MAKVPQVSFIIPAKDEEKTIPFLYSQIVYEMKRLRKSFEIIFVDDGSTDSTFEAAKKLSRKDKNVKVIKILNFDL